MTVALGLGIALGMTIPVIGFIIASFTSIIGAVAAVLATSEKNKSMNELDYQSSIQRHLKLYLARVEISPHLTNNHC